MTATTSVAADRADALKPDGRLVLPPATSAFEAMGDGRFLTGWFVFHRGLWLVTTDGYMAVRLPVLAPLPAGVTSIPGDVLRRVERGMSTVRAVIEEGAAFWVDEGEGPDGQRWLADRDCPFDFKKLGLFADPNDDAPEPAGVDRFAVDANLLARAQVALGVDALQIKAGETGRHVLVCEPNDRMYLRAADGRAAVVKPCGWIGG